MLIFDACSTQLIKDALASCKYCCQRNVPEVSCAVSRWLVQFRQLVGLLSALAAYVWVSVMIRASLPADTLSDVCVCVCGLIHAALAHLWCSWQRFRKVQNWRTGWGLMPITLHSCVASVLCSFKVMWPFPFAGHAGTSRLYSLH